jgi:serine/threonine protein kinase
MLNENRSDQPENEPQDAPEQAVDENTVATEENAEAAPPPEPEPEPEPLETVPVSEERAEAAGASGQLLEACPSCGSLMDVTLQPPFAKIHCPSCGQSLRARKQFKNYRLVEVVGEGGMGVVFKAVDCNLNRHVALKVLKREMSADAEAQEKLEEEARVTASINHPHVVKVFSFGEDHGQFYLAMELVEKGSLDHLMNIQRRVGEAQVLEVAIQIAQGLEAGLEKGLIHRDIKPGNILFVDAHTSKLVDFGLAIVADQAAQAKGEIWGTPYYIAPEKLDNQPEDYRSDIYSLGGTLFHALAGRPPYEAETASMVALKQLKSQPVSLQAFAPDISSETAYVVNRMLAKNPDDRYESYSELIEHLTYARNKLLERAQKPLQPKARVVMETRETKNLTAILSLVLLVGIVGIALLVYIFRDKIFPEQVLQAVQASSSAVASDAELKATFTQAVQQMIDRQFDEARGEFERLAATPGIKEPQKSWARMNEGLANILTGNGEKAAKIFVEIERDGLYSTDTRDLPLANFFVNAGKDLSKPDRVIPGSVTNLYSNQNFEAFGLLCFGMHDWELGKLNDGGNLLRAFMRCRVAEPDKWIESYKALVKPYAEDSALLQPIETALPRAKDAATAQPLLDKVRDARGKVQTGSRVTDRLDEIEAILKAAGAK